MQRVESWLRNRLRDSKAVGEVSNRRLCVRPPIRASGTLGYQGRQYLRARPR
jgi:hypothetical protein